MFRTNKKSRCGHRVAADASGIFHPSSGLRRGAENAFLFDKVYFGNSKNKVQFRKTRCET